MLLFTHNLRFSLSNGNRNPVRSDNISVINQIQQPCVSVQFGSSQTELADKQIVTCDNIVLLHSFITWCLEFKKWLIKVNK